MGGRVSAKLTISPGSPQCCCLSPKFYTVYSQDNTVIIKNANETTILGLFKSWVESRYWELVNSILVYGQDNNLTLSTDKTKELIMDFMRPLPFSLSAGTEVERADIHVPGSS